MQARRSELDEPHEDAGRYVSRSGLHRFRIRLEIRRGDVVAASSEVFFKGPCAHRDVRLIDRSWLNAHLEGGGALMRRQDLPETAFVPTSLDLVIEILIVSGSKIFNDRSNSCSIERGFVKRPYAHRSLDRSWRSARRLRRSHKSRHIDLDSLQVPLDDKPHFVRDSRV